MNDGVGQKKWTMDEQNERLGWLREMIKRKFFSNKGKKNKMFESSERTWKNEGFYWTNDFIERTVLLNEQFYWTIVQWENEWNRWKMNDNFENKLNNFFERMKKKRTKWVVHER